MALWRNLARWGSVITVQHIWHQSILLPGHTGQARPRCPRQRLSSTWLLEVIQCPFGQFERGLMSHSSAGKRSSREAERHQGVQLLACEMSMEPDVPRKMAAVSWNALGLAWWWGLSLIQLKLFAEPLPLSTFLQCILVFCRDSTKPLPISNMKEPQMLSSHHQLPRCMDRAGNCPDPVSKEDLPLHPALGLIMSGWCCEAFRMKTHSGFSSQQRQTHLKSFIMMNLF
jgi:hypothetical protein